MPRLQEASCLDVETLCYVLVVSKHYKDENGQEPTRSPAACIDWVRSRHASIPTGNSRKNFKDQVEFKVEVILCLGHEMEEDHLVSANRMMKIYRND
ncbi:hypothetical protein scyTo_0010043 [Scyliorhinus torazame]|uniref:Uncharacterized protein n=1 Tax=Scyliorhinus torazame TaxID=75743 RepID=A0A401NYU3_SCYTO|nr:hypothetical protein [Scyliorhinus torazame]